MPEFADQDDRDARAISRIAGSGNQRGFRRTRARVLDTNSNA